MSCKNGTCTPMSDEQLVQMKNSIGNLNNLIGKTVELFDRILQKVDETENRLPEIGNQLLDKLSNSTHITKLRQRLASEFNVLEFLEIGLELCELFEKPSVDVAKLLHEFIDSIDDIMLGYDDEVLEKRVDAKITELEKLFDK